MVRTFKSLAYKKESLTYEQKGFINMLNTKIFPLSLDLQLFAEGGAGGAAGAGDGGSGTGAEGATGANNGTAGATAAVSQRKGVKSNPLANVKYGVQPKEETTPAAEVKETVEEPKEDRKAVYEAFIKEYKDLDDERVQGIVKSRLKGSKETADKYNAVQPILDMLAKKYGVEPGNIEALNKAIADDDSYYEAEAVERGITVEQLKEFKKVERENAELRQRDAERVRREKAAETYSKWAEEAKGVKEVYPSFDLRAELQNEKFTGLLGAGIDVRTAFEVIHKDEILPAAMQYAAKKVEEKITDKIIANGARPAENGTSSQSATITKSDVSTLTKADRAEINRRVLRGEKITFGR